MDWSMGGTATPQYFPRRGELDMEPSLTWTRTTHSVSDDTMHPQPRTHHDIIVYLIWHCPISPQQQTAA